MQQRKFSYLYIAVVLVILSLLGFGLTKAMAETGGGATAVVNGLHDTLLKAMRGGSAMGYSGRYKTVESKVKQSYDFPGIAKVVLGRHWAKLTEDQRSRFLEAFERLGVATYASRFDGFSGETFKSLSEETGADGRATVRTELRKSDGDIVKLDYVLNKVGSNWLIVNVIADGVSDLSLKRADYSAVMKSDGIEKLIGKLNDKIALYSTTKANVY
jgi:phospholipid transport system substrate-binding protein